MLGPKNCLYPALCETLVWVRDLTASGDVSAALPLDRLAVLRGIAPRTLRDHLARLEHAGLLQRRYAGQRGISLCVLSQAEAEEGCTPEAGAVEALAGPSDSAASAPGVAPDKVALLTAAGVYLPVARALAGRPWVTAEIIAAWVEELSRISAVRNLAAVLVYRLQEPSRCLPLPRHDSDHGAMRVRQHARGNRDSWDAEEPEMTILGHRDVEGRDRAAQLGRALAGHPARDAVGSAAAVAGTNAGERVRVQFSRGEEQADAELRAVDSAADAVVALWEPIRVAMATRLGPDVDRLWLQRARPQSLSDGVLLLTVPTALGAEWLNLSGAPRCYEAICEAAGRQLLLRFVPAGSRDCP